MANSTSAIARKKMRTTPKKALFYIKRDRMLWLLILPGLAYFIIFKYVPMFGVLMAFQDYRPQELSRLLPLSLFLQTHPQHHSHQRL